MTSFKLIASRPRNVPAQQPPPSRLPIRHIDGPQRFAVSLWAVLFLLSALCPLNSVAWAASPGTTTAELLKIPVGARAIGMGEAFTALADDSSAIDWNPAGMAFLEQKEASFMHSSLIENIHYEHLAFVAPGDSYSFGTSLGYLGYGSIAGYDNSGNAIGDQTANSYNLNGAIAKQFHDSLSLGLSAGFIRESLAGDSAGTFTFNGGALYKVPAHPWKTDYSLGASVLNIGPGLKFVNQRDPLPRKIKFGAAASHIDAKPLTLTADITVPNDNDTYVSLGSEYWFKDLLALRLGYDGSNDVGKGLRLGFGLKYWGFLFDYAYGGFGDFGATHRIGVAFRFGEKIKQLNSEERAILKEAKAARDRGDYVQSILGIEEILSKNPENDHVLHLMIDTHETMLKKDLGEAVAQQVPAANSIPSPEAAALSDLIPGQALAQNLGGVNPAAIGVATLDPMGYNQLPDTTRLDGALMDNHTDNKTTVSPVHTVKPMEPSKPVESFESKTTPAPEAVTPQAHVAVEAPDQTAALIQNTVPEQAARPAFEAPVTASPAPATVPSPSDEPALSPADIYGN